MIISHKHKFIFIQPPKVAGTSVGKALAKHCGGEDIIVSDGKFYKGRNSEDPGPHMTAMEIKKMVGEEVWRTYTKISVVRNPWDRLVSSYCHFKSIPKPNTSSITNPKKVMKNLFNPDAHIFLLRSINNYFPWSQNKNELSLFIETLTPDEQTCKNFYFESGTPLDFYIRFENLEEDYRKFCNIIGIPYKKLPKTRHTLRNHRRHYSEYYDEYGRKLVEKVCKEEIGFFSYEFEGDGGVERVKRWP